VAGVNLEAKLGYRKLLLLQGGYTFQRSRYTEDFAWSENPNIAPQRRMFRTPDNYGYFLATLTPVHDFSIAINGKITGSMLVQHYAGYLYLWPCAPPYLVPGAEPKALRRVS